MLCPFLFSRCHCFHGPSPKSPWSCLYILGLVAQYLSVTLPLHHRQLPLHLGREPLATPWLSHAGLASLLSPSLGICLATGDIPGACLCDWLFLAAVRADWPDSSPSPYLAQALLWSQGCLRPTWSQHLEYCGRVQRDLYADNHWETMHSARIGPVAGE